MILKLLKGRGLNAQKRLEDLTLKIGGNPNILWYPSAGNDFRDILELCPQRAAELGIEILPDLIVHTDYKPDWMDFKGTIYEDHRTKIEIVNRYYYDLSQKINYEVNPEYVDFPEDALPSPLVLLLDVKITSDTLGTIERPVLYFLFENINFLDQILLKNKICVSHIIKVREGLAWGGNKKSIGIVLSFLSVLETRYLLSDKKDFDIDFDLIDKLKTDYQLSLYKYTISRVGYINDWSGLFTGVYSIGE